MSERQPSWRATPSSPPVPSPSPGVVPPSVYTPASGVGHVAGPGYGPQPMSPGFAPHPAGAYARPPSGLFPGPSRPIYREPHPIAAAPVLSGFGATLIWLALFGGLAHDLASYAWWTIVASVTAWAMALVLTFLGDRGVAVGIALAGGLGLAIAAGLVGSRWIDTYDWPLW